MNKIFLAQIDTIAGNISFNAEKIINYIQKAKEQGAELVIFPELALTGYPFGDILMRHKYIVKQQLYALEEIIKKSYGITVILGYVEPDEKDGRQFLYNSLAVIQEGKKLFSARKIFMPDYEKSCDCRYFESETSETIIINGIKYGILFSGDNFNSDIYTYAEELMRQKTQAIINCACSPSRCSREQIKNEFFSSIAKKYGINYIYVNKAGYGDNYSFDGISRIYNKEGKITLQAKAFEEDFASAVDFKGKINEFPTGMREQVNFDNFELNYTNDLNRTYRSIVFSIKQYFEKNGFNKAVLGLSGGLDSSVCAVLLSEALGGENVWGISMPSKITSKESRDDAEILAKNLGIHFLEIPLIDLIEPMKSMLNKAFEDIKSEKYKNSTTIENLQARLRASILWSISNEYKGMLPIATSDKSEAYIGYATVNGDMTGGFAPIADVTKTKLFALADFLNKNIMKKEVIPQSILEKPPGAELKINSKTGKTVSAEEDNMPYEFLDEIIWLIENKNYSKQEIQTHKFLYENKHILSIEQKNEWINKFYWKTERAVFKWHIMPPSVIIENHTINSSEYRQPIISKIHSGE